MPETDSMAALLSDVLDARLRELHVAGPGRVVSYNASRETVDVQPQFQRTIETEDRVFLHEAYPIIPDVPIAWPSGNGGDCFFTIPLAAGDPVLLVFLERDPGAYRDSGDTGPTGDLRMHGLGGAVAYPGGLRPNGEVLGSGKRHATKVVIGSGVLLGSSSADQPIPKGTALKAAYDTHVHPTAMGPSGPPSAPLPAGALSTIHRLDQ